MARRLYSNVAVDTTLATGIAAGDVSMTVVTDTGWPSAPFVAVIDPDTADEELVLVGAKSGTTFSSLTRGFGGTSARSHGGDAEVKHVAVAEDFDLVWTHSHDGLDDSATVDHDDLIGVSANDHHQQAHLHDGSDGSGLLGNSVIATDMITDAAVSYAKIETDAFFVAPETLDFVPAAFDETTATMGAGSIVIPAGWGGALLKVTGWVKVVIDASTGVSAVDCSWIFRVGGSIFRAEDFLAQRDLGNDVGFLYPVVAADSVAVGTTHNYEFQMAYDAAASGVFATAEGFLMVEAVRTN